MPRDDTAPSSPPDPTEALEGYRPDPDDLMAFGWVPYEKRWDGEGRMPTINVLFEGDVPRLSHIHPRRWGAVIAPYDEQRRWRLADSQGLTIKELAVANAVVAALPPPAQAIARAAVRSPTLQPAPEVAAPVRARAKGRRPGRQVNVRLDPLEYEDLLTAAEIAGTKPTTLARWLLLAGARRVLRDHAEAYSEVRSRS
jgi:hypothetical protein